MELVNGQLVFHGAFDQWGPEHVDDLRASVRLEFLNRTICLDRSAPPTRKPPHARSTCTLQRPPSSNHGLWNLDSTARRDRLRLIPHGIGLRDRVRDPGERIQ